MSYAFRARKKEIRRRKDEADPERKEIRNSLRNGKAPRLSTVGRTRVKSAGKAPTLAPSKKRRDKGKLSIRATTENLQLKRKGHLAFSSDLILKG